MQLICLQITLSACRIVNKWHSCYIFSTGYVTIYLKPVHGNTCYTCLEDWLHIRLLALRCRGRGDGILTVRDGGPAPVTFAPFPPSFHPTASRHAPVPYVIHTNLNSTNTTLMSSGEERHLGRERGRAGGGFTEKGGKRPPEVFASLFPIVLHPHPPTPPPDTSWHTITWDALTCFTEGRSLGNKEVSGNTHRLCGWISNVVSFSFSSGGFVLYYFVCVETLGSVTCSICSGQWRNWPVSSWLKQREI